MLFISEIQLDYHNISDLCVLVHNRQELVYSVEPVGIPAAERTSFWLVKHRIDRNWFYIQVVESFTNFDESLHGSCVMHAAMISSVIETALTQNCEKH